MAAGRPVVATRVGGAAEAIEEGSSGYLVNAGDDESLAERLIRLLSDTARAEEMGQRGKEIVSEKFSSEAQLRRTTNLYDELLNRQSSELVAAVGSARRGNA